MRKVPDQIEVTIECERTKTRRPVNFIIHRSRDFDRSQCVVCKGILITPRLRILVDLAATGTDEQLAEALDTALAKQAVTVPDLLAEIRRLARPGRPGIVRLRLYLADRGFADAPPPSVLESHLHRLVTRLSIPYPSVEVVAGEDGQYRLDTAWEDIKFAVEVDGYAYHFSPEQKRKDELRRQRLREQGWTLLVFDWQQLTKQRAWVANEVRTTFLRLAAKAAESGPATRS